VPTREAIYIIRIVQYLARSANLREGSTAMILHNELDIPCVHLRGVLRRLAVSGIIHSKRGRTGGVILDAKVPAFNILDVLKAVDAVKSRKNTILWDPGSPRRESDTIHALFVESRDKAHEVFKRITVAQLAVRD
jgi:Rrf2 family protein